MDFQVYYPQGMLKHFMGSIHYMSGSGTGVAFQRLYQTIIINMDGPFRVSDIYNTIPGAREQLDTVWINGKQEIPFMLENPSMKMYVLGIRTGMLPFLADIPAIATNELAVEAVHWTSQGIYQLREQLLECSTIHAGFVLIDDYFTRILAGKDHTDFSRISWLGKAIHSHTVEEICHSLGVTRKKLRSETQHYFGDSVKNLQGILRFNHHLSSIAHNMHRSLSSIHSYYDQAHFINDFKARCGITPLQYKQLCRQFPYIRHTPNFLPMEKETFLQFISPRPE
jgi:AraC-like DNA-binding protein